MKIFLFLVVKFSIYLNRCVFIMYGIQRYCRFVLGGLDPDTVLKAAIQDNFYPF